MRFDFAQFSGAEQAQAAQAVRKAALVQSMEARDFFRTRGHHDFPAYLVRNRVHLAELNHLPDAAHGEARLARAGLVIKPAVQHAAVVPALVPAHGGFLFKYCHPLPG